MIMCESCCGFKDLNPDLVEKGWVKKREVCRNGLITMTELSLGPNAKIKRHQEVSGSEIYISATTGKTYFCKKGDFHELENDTNEIQRYYSIKVRED